MPSNIFTSGKLPNPVFGGLFNRGARKAQVNRVSQAESLPGDDRNKKQSEKIADVAVSNGAEVAVAPLVAVLGAKGGVGASTIALNLAAAAGASGESATLVDAHFQVPDLANLVGSEASHSLLELTSRGSNIDQLLFQACRMDLVANNPSVGALLPPSDGSAFLHSDLTQLAACLDQVRPFGGVFFVDVPKHLDRHLVTLLDSCTKIILVFEATISGVAACRRWLQTFLELGYESDRIMLVVNRAGSKYKVVEEQLGTCFADKQIWKIPNASSLTWDSSNHGVPVVLSSAGSPYSKAINKLFQDLQSSLQIKSQNVLPPITGRK